MKEIAEEEIEKVLDEKVRPNLLLHGGNIKIVRLENGTLYLRMLGQCSGCPSVEITMENLVTTELKEAFPGLGQVSLVSGVSDDLIAEAKRLLNERKH